MKKIIEQLEHERKNAFTALQLGFKTKRDEAKAMADVKRIGDAIRILKEVKCDTTEQHTSTQAPESAGKDEKNSGIKSTK